MRPGVDLLAIVEPVKPGLIGLLSLLDLAVIGLAALGFIIILRIDSARPAWTWTGSRPGSRFLAAAHGLIGLVILLAALFVENALGLRSIRVGGWGAILGLGLLLVYLGLSSLGLAWASWITRPAPLLNRVHPFLAALATGVLILAKVDPQSKAVVLVLALVTLASTILAFYQFLQMSAPGGSLPAGRDPATTLPSDPARSRDRGDEGAFPPELLARFSDPKIIARGGFSRVFSARRRDSGEMVAVKIPAAMDEETGKAFLREIRTWEHLRHGNILAIHGANILPVPYLEMEYLPRSLAGLEKPVDPAVAARIMAGIARGLAYAHSRGVIHRDLKPGNILLSDALEPKIGDWGLSRLLAGGTTLDPRAFSPGYAAPEQLDPEHFGIPDERTDIYSFGAVYYELLTGEPPFTSETIAGLVQKILREFPVPPSEKNPAARPAEGIILRCLEKDPSKRYPGVRELAKDLGSLLPGKS